MSYPPAHHKPKPVGVPQHQAYQQPRHNTAPRHQQYRSQPQPRDNRAYSNIQQPPRHPSPIPGQPPGPGLTGSPSPSPSSVPQQPPPTALGTGAPHDMNKQGAPSRPALTPSPVQQGTIIPGQMLINSQQIMYAQQSNMPRGQTVYMPIQANQRGNPRGGMQMSNMSQTQQGAQPQATYQNQPLNIAGAPFIPSSHHVPQSAAQYMMQPQMMIPQANMYAPRQPIQQIQYHQPTAVFQQPNTPPFYQGSPPVSASAGAFFPQNQTLVATQQPQMRQQPPTMTVQQTQPRLPPKERKIIRIVDPTSNTDITDAIMREGTSSTGTTPTHSGRSSASSTPPAVSNIMTSGPPPPTQPNQLNDKARAIQASFAAQVALAAADTAKPQAPNQTSNSQGMVPQQLPAPQMVPQQMPVRVAAVPSQNAAVPSQSAAVAQVPPSNPPASTPKTMPVENINVPMAIASQVQKQAPMPIRPADVVPAPTQVVSSNTTPISAPVPAPAVPKQTEEVTDKKPSVAESDSSPDAAGETEEKEKSASESVAEQQSAPVSTDKVAPAKDKSAEKSDSKPQEEVETSKEDTSVKVKEEVVAETVPAKKLSKDEKSGETAKQEPVSKTIPQVETVEKTSTAKEAAPQKKETSSEAKPAPVKESSKKKNQKKRLQELDKKSTKEDDVYDAYKDTETPESKPTAPAVEEKKPEIKVEVTPAVEKPQQQAVPEKTSTKESKTELPKQEKKEKPEPDVESEKLAEKDMPKEVEVSVVDSVDKKEREKVEAENAKNKESMDNEDDSNKPAPKDNKIQLKYTYREDQWSPVNPEGKKQYGRDFLLQFQPECKDKPDGLPHIPDIVLDKADIRPISGVADPKLQSTRTGGGGGRGGGGIDFMPDYMRSQRGNQGAPPQFPQPSGGRRSREPKKVIARASQGPEVSLKKADNAWKPGIKEKKETTIEGGDKTEDLVKKFKSILNKLTPQNFQTLMARTLALPIDNEERLTVIIDLVFEKAISESAFSKAYANMCRVLSQIKVPAANATGIVQFRTVLINRCQRAFEAEKKEEATWAEMKKEIEKMKEGSSARQVKEEELFILQVKAKQKVLGNMRFIGELFKLRMLTENIMHDCIFKLLRAKDDESLECMSQLMNTVGKDLDHERAKNRMDQYFTQISKIIGNKKMSARIRFMLQDVQDLRKCNWVPRRDDNNPKTIAQIHQEAKQEEQQKKIEAQMAIHAHASKSREKSSSGGGRGGRPAPQQPDSDWQTVAVSNKGRPTIDPSKLINLGKNRPNNDDVQLGPGGRPGAFGSWGRGSSGGGAKMQSSDQVDLRPAGNNRYAMLSDQGRGTRPGMAPPTRDSKGRPTGSIPSRRSRERDDGRGSSREDPRQRERMQLLDEVQRTMSGARSRSSEKDRKPSRDRGSARGSREGGNRRGGSREEGGSRDRGSRERKSSREAATPSPPVGKPVAAKPAAPQLSDEDFEKKGRATLDEYLNIRDFKEACYCISELNSPDRMHLFVRLSIEHVLEMNAQSRLDTGALFHRLIKDNLLSVQQYLQGLNEILEFADDMAIDIPLIWEYLGQVMGSMIQDKSQTLDYLGKALEPVKVAGKAGMLLAEILTAAETNIGAEDLNDLWQSTGFTWQQFLPDGENVTEFVNNKKLGYTLQKRESSRSGGNDALATMTKELGFMLASGKCDNDNIFDWIKKNTDPEVIKQKDFIRALVTIVCQSTMEGDSSRCDPELLKVRAKSLLRYIDGDVDRELQALYAVQALNHKLVNPPGFLRLIFDVLYDEDVISEETFYAWQNSSDPAEQAGKGVALKSVTSFFAWLGEAEEEVVS